MKKIKQEVYNRTPFTTEEIQKFKQLGMTVNNWRQRNIVLYQHPTDENKVVSVGTTFDGNMVVMAVEEKSQWKTALEYAERGKVYTSN